VSRWPAHTLGGIFDIARGGSPRPIDDYLTDAPDGINWISISDASESSKFITRTKRRIKPSGESRSRRVQPGDFLLTNSMSFGRPYIMQTTGCIHDGWLVLRPREEIHADYFYHLLGSAEVYAKFVRLAAGVTVKNLNIDLVSGVEVSVPPLAEQRRIAAILDEADALRAKRRAALAQLDEMAQAIFVEIFGDPIRNPHRFPTDALADLVDPTRGISYGIVQRGQDQDNGVPVLRISDIVGGLVETGNLKRTTAEIASRYRRTHLCGGELAISIRGTVGRIAIVPETLAGGNVSREIAVIPLLSGISPAFVRDLIRNPSVQQRLIDDVVGVAQSGINLEDLRKLPVLRPNSTRLNAYVTAVTELEAMSQDANQSANNLDSLFASLQHRAFRGEL
jgi:type I restriction enzyme, S subunit